MNRLLASHNHNDRLATGDAGESCASVSPSVSLSSPVTIGANGEGRVPFGLACNTTICKTTISYSLGSKRSAVRLHLHVSRYLVVRAPSVSVGYHQQTWLYAGPLLPRPSIGAPIPIYDDGTWQSCIARVHESTSVWGHILGEISLSSLHDLRTLGFLWHDTGVMKKGGKMCIFKGTQPDTKSH